MDANDERDSLSHYLENWEKMKSAPSIAFSPTVYKKKMNLGTNLLNPLTAYILDTNVKKPTPYTYIYQLLDDTPYFDKGLYSAIYSLKQDVDPIIHFIQNADRTCRVSDIFDSEQYM